MEAIQLLIADHRKVRNLFDQFKAQTDRSHQIRVFSQIFNELQMHTRIEESVFYPACNEFPECQELVEDALEDHQTVKDQLAEIRALSQDSDQFVMMVEDLMDDVEDHVEEEEQEFFPLVRELMQESELLRLGERMEGIKKEEGAVREKKAA
jgi:hemerythrin superfamily protein